MFSPKWLGSELPLHSPVHPSSLSPPPQSCPPLLPSPGSLWDPTMGTGFMDRGGSEVALGQGLCVFLCLPHLTQGQRPWAWNSAHAPDDSTEPEGLGSHLAASCPDGDLGHIIYPQWPQCIPWETVLTVAPTAKVVVRASCEVLSVSMGPQGCCMAAYITKDSPSRQVGG